MTGMLNESVGSSHSRIKVYCRPRQLDAPVLKERGGCAVDCGGAEKDEIDLTYRGRDDKSRKDTYGFDRVFSPNASNVCPCPANSLVVLARLPWPS